MTAYTERTITTTRREFVLTLPSCTGELDKMWAAMAAKWADDYPLQRRKDDDIAVTSNGEELVFSWELRRNPDEPTNFNRAKVWDLGYGAGFNGGVQTNPYRS